MGLALVSVSCESQGSKQNYCAAQCGVIVLTHRNEATKDLKMLQQNNVKVMSEIIAKAMLNQSTFDFAESVYGDVFRSADSFCINDFSGAQREEVLSMMVDELCSDVYPKQEAQFYCDDCFDFEAECDFDPEPIAKGLSRSDALELINSGARFVYLCNYKGEDEGILLEVLAGRVRVFVSKWNYV